ncbi:MAG: TIM-barrel domain-containing protein, partial [Terriglobales bacterium]
MVLPPNRRQAVKRLAAAAAGAMLAPRWAAAFTTRLELAKRPIELTLTPMSRRTVRITLRGLGGDLVVGAGLSAPAARVPRAGLDDGAIAPGPERAPAARLAALAGSRTVRCGGLSVRIEPAPLRLHISGHGGRLLQEIVATTDAGGGVRYGFRVGAAPLFGLGQGGPQLDKRGSLDAMGSGQGGYRLATHGAKVPIQVLWSAEGWGLFAHRPLGAFDLTDSATGWLMPRPDRGGHEPGEALPGAGEALLGLPLDLFVMDGGGAPPSALLAEYAALTGLSAMPPLWSLGYQQSHRTLGAPEEILAEARTFREKQLPCDVMIYLGTGFCPEGWNTANGEFTWNPKAFPDPAMALAELH